MSNQPDDLPHRKTQQGGLTLSEGAQITIGQGDVVVGDKTVNVLSSKEDARTRRDHLILLNKVKEFWVKGVLEKSVHAEALIELGKQTQIDAIEHQRPWDMALETSEQESRPLPPGKRIVEIFDETDRALLILGAPGSGKTITLLELARDLIARAESDPAQPIPVVFNLSAWAERKLSLAEWLADELSLKYQIPRKIGRKWLADADILPLLDGLDEVRAESRTECVEAVNAYHKEHSLAGIAVCSRHEEYGLLKEKLKLGGAILIQALNDEQVTDYLASFGTKLAGLYKALRLDATLKELAASPLMLGVMSLAYADVSLEDVLRGKLDSIEARRKHLFDAYVERMFKRKGGDIRYSPKQTVKWLSWLAQGMKKHGQTTFLIEGLQPSWIDIQLWRWIYVFGSRLMATFGIAISNAYFVLSGVFIRVIGLESGLFTFLVRGLLHFLSIWLIGGLGIGIIDSIRLEVDLSSRFKFSVRVKLMINVLIFGVVVGAGVGLSTGVINSLIAESGDRLANGLATGLSNGLFLGTICALIFGLRAYKQRIASDIQTVESLNWSWRKAAKNSVGGLVIGLGLGIISVFLLYVLTGLTLFDRLYEFLRAASITVTIDDSLIWSTVVGEIMLIGIVGMLTIGLLGGLTSGVVDFKLAPNQGIRLSLRNSLFASFIFGLGIEVAAGLTFGIILVLTGAINIFGTSFAISTFIFSLIFAIGATILITLVIVIFLGPFLGLLGALWYGGLDFIYHYTLRLILALNQYIPWNLAPFLDYCADRVFLQKVGGGYIFIHRLLLEYFAEKG